MRRNSVRGLAILLLGLALTPLYGQTLYKYRDAAGHWVYSDRYPAELIEAAYRQDAVSAGGIRLLERSGQNGSSSLVAVNELATWAQVAFRVEASRNLDPDARKSGNALLPPESETPLMQLPAIDASAPAEVSFSYQYILGHPGASHEPDGPYRLPYASANAHRVTQAWPDQITHVEIADRYAVDFEMPVGTAVLAARAGTVVEVAGHFTITGSDFDRSGAEANFVRILHDDGTLALYGHLDHGSIRVAPGQRIERAEHIADSGNTGYSMGPHLHFVVQRNHAGAVESIPVSFAGPDGATLSPQTGDRPVAW